MFTRRESSSHGLKTRVVPYFSEKNTPFLLGTGHVFQVLRDEPNVGFGSNRTWASVPGKSGYGSGWGFLSSFSALHRTSLSRWKGVGLSLNFLTYSPTRIEKLLFYPCG